MTEGNLPLCVRKGINSSGYNALYDVNKLISHLEIDGIVLAIVPVEPDRDEMIYLSITGAWATLDTKEILLSTLNAQRDIVRSVPAKFSSQIETVLQNLANEIRSFGADTNRDYWLMLLAPLGIRFRPMFYLTGQPPDYDFVTIDEIVELITSIVKRLK